MISSLKKVLILILFSIFSLFFAACSFNNSKTAKSLEKEKINVVATMFPLYDFTKNIAKDRADLSLFLPPGVDGHDFEISAKDIVKVSDADLFLSSGVRCEPWVEKVRNSFKGNDVFADVTDGINFLKKNSNENYVDSHIWLDLSNAEILVDNILKKICEKDPENSDFYKSNAQNYKKSLKKLDNEFAKIVEKSKIRKIVFAGKFASLYFVKKYNLGYIAAYTSCEENAEPAPKKISEIIDFIKANNVPAIFYEEPEDLKLAETVANATGVKILKFNTLHTVSKSQFDAGVSYIDLMHENLESLKRVLC